MDQACRAADEFVNIYYETMDKRRRVCTVLTIVKTVLALFVCILAVITQKAPEHWFPCAVLAVVERGNVPQFVLLCSLAVKGAVHKCLRLLMTLMSYSYRI